MRPADPHRHGFMVARADELRTAYRSYGYASGSKLESPRERDELEAALRSVGHESDRLSQLAEDLLLLARLDKGTLPIRRDEVDLDELLGGMAVRFERRARDAGRTIESNGDSWLIVTTMIEDPQYLNQQFQRSTHFKRLPDGSTWSPSPCTAR